MNNVFRNILGIIAGIIVGGFVNMSIINLSGYVIPPPEGADVTTVEGVKASIHLFAPKHFIMPFLAHALGTLVSAFVAALIAASHKIKIAVGIGVFSLLGGIAASLLIPAPAWFIVLDLVAAYIPMGWIGGRLAYRNKSWSGQSL